MLTFVNKSSELATVNFQDLWAESRISIEQNHHSNNFNKDIVNETISVEPGNWWIFKCHTLNPLRLHDVKAGEAASVNCC